MANQMWFYHIIFIVMSVKCDTVVGQDIVPLLQYQNTRQISELGHYVKDHSGKYKPDRSGFYNPDDRVAGFYDPNDRTSGYYNQTERLSGLYDVSDAAKGYYTHFATKFEEKLLTSPTSDEAIERLHKSTNKNYGQNGTFDFGGRPSGATNQNYFNNESFKETDDVSSHLNSNTQRTGRNRNINDGDKFSGQPGGSSNRFNSNSLTVSENRSTNQDFVNNVGRLSEQTRDEKNQSYLNNSDESFKKAVYSSRGFNSNAHHAGQSGATNQKNLNNGGESSDQYSNRRDRLSSSTLRARQNEANSQYYLKIGGEASDKFSDSEDGLSSSTRRAEHNGAPNQNYLNNGENSSNQSSVGKGRLNANVSRTGQNGLTNPNYLLNGGELSNQTHSSNARLSPSSLRVGQNGANSQNYLNNGGEPFDQFSDSGDGLNSSTLRAAENGATNQNYMNNGETSDTGQNEVTNQHNLNNGADSSHQTNGSRGGLNSNTLRVGQTAANSQKYLNSGRKSSDPFSGSGGDLNSSSPLEGQNKVTSQNYLNNGRESSDQSRHSRNRLNSNKSHSDQSLELDNSDNPIVHSEGLIRYNIQNIHGGGRGQASSEYIKNDFGGGINTTILNTASEEGSGVAEHKMSVLNSETNALRSSKPFQDGNASEDITRNSKIRDNSIPINENSQSQSLDLKNLNPSGLKNDMAGGNYWSLLQHYKPTGDSDYHYYYRTKQGSYVEENGYFLNKGSRSQTLLANGQYSFTSPEGMVYDIMYVADKNGFVPVGSHLPTPPPIPPLIQRALEYTKNKGLTMEQTTEQMM